MSHATQPFDLDNAQFSPLNWSANRPSAARRSNSLVDRTPPGTSRRTLWLARSLSCSASYGLLLLCMYASLFSPAGHAEQ